MADILDENGLQVDSYATLLSNLQTGLNNIYATDGNLINFDSSTPDGQCTNILTQMGTDVRELTQRFITVSIPINAVVLCKIHDIHLITLPETVEHLQSKTLMLLVIEQ